LIRLAPEVEAGGDLLLLDGGTRGAVRRGSAAGTVRIDGYGLAIVSDDARGTVVD
jgi:hypothetical protein